MRSITIRNYFLFLLSASLFALMLPTHAQDEPPAVEAPAVEAEEPASTLTQGQAAVIIARSLGLFSGQVAVPTQAQSIQLLLARNISPAGGWDPAAELSAGDLARMLVFALGSQDELSEAELAADNNDPFIDLILEKTGTDIPAIITANRLNRVPILAGTDSFDGATSDPLIILPLEEFADEDEIPVDQEDLEETLASVVASQGGSGGQVDGGSNNITPSGA